MFAKRQPVAIGAPAPSSGRKLDARALLDLIKKPYVSAIAAGVLFVGAAGTLFIIAADPFAGAPNVRVALNRPKPGQRQTAANAGMQAFTVDSLGMYQDLAVPGFEGADNTPAQGTATITFPDGGSSAGATRPNLPPRKGPVDPLAPAPMAGLSQQRPMGPLPVIAGDGRSSFQAYARPFASNGQPRVALIVGGLGLNPAATKAAIERLPPEITLSFVPYSQGLQGWIDLARANGHEVMLEIPMEPTDYPDNDPGPYTLLSSANAQDTTKRVEWLLSRATGYFGVTNYLGQKFVNSDTGMGAFLGVLKQRGVAFYDDGSARRRSGAYARATADAIVDDQLSAEAIANQLNSLEQAAKMKGSALGSGFAYPVTVEVAARWAETLKSRGLQLAPASAIARR